MADKDAHRSFAVSRAGQLVSPACPVQRHGKPSISLISTRRVDTFLSKERETLGSQNLFHAMKDSGEFHECRKSDCVVIEAPPLAAPNLKKTFSRLLRNFSRRTERFVCLFSLA